jgi:hypothetical protein
MQRAGGFSRSLKTIKETRCRIPSRLPNSGSFYRIFDGDGRSMGPQRYGPLNYPRALQGSIRHDIMPRSFIAAFLQPSL